jgi:hypothetical protein
MKFVQQQLCNSAHGMRRKTVAGNSDTDRRERIGPAAYLGFYKERSGGPPEAETFLQIYG